MKPELPEKETGRLLDLYSLDILDTQPEERFDRITRLAAAFFAAPIALVSLVDRDRQWFKSNQGLPLQETTRDTAVCSHAIEERDILVIPDMAIDPRFSESPLVTEEGLRFYAGAILRSAKRQPLGTLCILDTVPRNFPRDKREQLLDFAQLAERELNEGTRLEQLKSELLQHALYDPNSGFATKRLFLEKVETCLSGADKAAMVILGIPDYRTATMDLSSGDQIRLKRELAQRVNRLFQSADVVGDLGDGRYSALFLMEPDTSGTSGTRLRERGLQTLKREFSMPLSSSGGTFLPTIGISIYPDDGEEAMQLLTKAELARPRKSSSLKDPMAVFSKYRAAEIKRASDIESRLRLAVDNGSLSLHYQPKFILGERVPQGYEALLRWNDPVLGFIGPDEFIPIAEKNGLIQTISSWVVEQALEDWPKICAFTGNPETTVAINVSANDLVRPGFSDWVAGSIRTRNISASAIIFEITESSLISDIDLTSKTMRELRKLGVNFHIDDFGTGFSNLNQLHQLPLDALKVDRSFVSQLGRSENGETVCRSIIGLAKSLGLKVIGEGVETRDQLQKLADLNCDAFQGFLFGRPADLASFGQGEDGVEKAR